LTENAPVIARTRIQKLTSDESISPVVEDKISRFDSKIKSKLKNDILDMINKNRNAYLQDIYDYDSLHR